MRSASMAISRASGLAQGPSDDLAAEELDHHGQEQPPLVGCDVGDVARPDLVGLSYAALAIEQVGRGRRSYLLSVVTLRP